MARRYRFIGWLAGLGVLCGGGAAAVVGSVYLSHPPPQPCQAPPYQESLLSAYLAWVAYLGDLAHGIPVTGTGAVFFTVDNGVGASANYLGGTLSAFDAPRG